MKGMANICAGVIHDVDFGHFSEGVNYIAGVAVNCREDDLKLEKIAVLNNYFFVKLEGIWAVFIVK